MTREANENMVREVAQRIAASESHTGEEVLPPEHNNGHRVISTVLSYLVRPRVCGGRLCSVVVRVTIAGRIESDRKTLFYYYRDPAEGLQAHPNAKVSPWPYVDGRRAAPHMEIRMEIQQSDPAT